MSDPGKNKPKDAPPARPRPKAPPPPTELGGRSGWSGWTPPPKHTQIPPNPPAYFPSDLWPRTQEILDEAIERFPDQRQLPELCRRYIAKMTPLYCGAVKSGKIKAHWVLQEDLGGMLDLLRSLLVSNDDRLFGPSLGGLSDEARQIYKEAGNSEEFRKLRKAIIAAQVEMPGNEKRAEPSQAQNSANSEPRQEARAKARGESLFTKAVKKALLHAPGASGLEISMSIDEDGIEPSAAMKANNVQSYEEAYRKKIGRLDSRYSRIRRTMRKMGLL